MNRCPNCSYLIPPSWDVCKKCGTVLRAAAVAHPPAARVAVVPSEVPAAPGTPLAGAPDLDLLPGRRPPAEPVRRSAPGDLLPTPVPARASLVSVKVAETPKRAATLRRGHLLMIGGLVVVAAVVAWTFRASSGGEDPASDGSGDDVVILPSPDEMAGAPSVEGALRVEAEAGVQQALVLVSQAYAEYADLAQVTAELLTQYDPSLQFVSGSEESTASGVVSLRVAPDAITVAVAGRGDICAFGRVDVNMVTDRVTAQTPSCRADGAPATGWYGGTGGALGPAVEDLLTT